MNMFKNKSKCSVIASIAKQSILALTLAGFLAACGDDSGSNVPDEPSSSSVVKEKSSSSAKAKSSSSKAKSSSSAKATSSSSVKASSSSTAKSSSSVKADDQKYVFSFLMETSQYIGVGSLVDDQSKIVKNFIEAPQAGSVAYFKGSIYVLAADDAANSTLSRYEYKNGKMAEKASATTKFTGTNAIVMKFVDNKMYVNQAFGDAITVLDPITLKTTATIDLSKYIDEEHGALSTVPGSCVLRDGKLFVSLNQFVDFQNFIAGSRGSVAIIDTKTDKVEKVIYEDMTAVLGGMDDMNTTASFVDEKGDIYFYANASYSFIEGYKEGWVRVKKGETEFDTSWVFRMHDAAYDGKSKNNYSLMVGGTYIGNGKFIGFFGTFEDPSNFNNYEWQFVVVDVYKKSVQKIDLSPTIPWFAPSIHLDADGKSVLMGHADKKGGAIYRYNIASGKVTKEMTVSTGTAYYIVPVQD